MRTFRMASKSRLSGFRLLALAALITVGAPPCQAADTFGKIRSTKTITLAHRESSVPFSYLDANKKPVGYSMDLCLKLVSAIKRELKLPQLEVAYLPVTASTRIAAIVDGKADLECGSTTNNAERRKTVAFTVPHFIALTRMVVRTDSGIKNWPDLHGKKVVTTKGTTTLKLLSERDKMRAIGFKLVEGADHVDSFGMVEKGTADAFPMDDVLLFGLRANAKTPANFTIVGDQLSAEPYAIMMRKDDAAFKHFIDMEMARIVLEGDLQKTYAKWFNHPIPPKGVNLNMPMGYLLRDSLAFPTDKVAD